MKVFLIGRYRKGRLEMVMVRHSPPPKKPLRLLKRRQSRASVNHHNHYLTLVK